MKLEAIAFENDDEFEGYITKSPCLLLGRMRAINWWCESAQRTKYPTLSQLVIEVLLIPGMSDKPESIFSGCRRLVSWDRTAISVKALEAAECVKDWMRADILKNPV